MLFRVSPQPHAATCTLSLTMILAQLKLLLKTELGILIGGLKNDLEEQDVQVKDVLPVVHKFCDVCAESEEFQNAENVPELLYELQDKQFISIYSTQMLEQIIETFSLTNCREGLKKFYKAHLIPYLKICQDYSYKSLQSVDQNISLLGNNRKLVVLNLGEEWNNLSEKTAKVAKIHIASLLDIEATLLRIHGGTTHYNIELVPLEAQTTRDTGSAKSPHSGTEFERHPNVTNHQPDSLTYSLKSNSNSVMPL